jgi:hypothetical protein
MEAGYFVVCCLVKKVGSNVNNQTGTQIPRPSGHIDAEHVNSDSTELLPSGVLFAFGLYYSQ